MSDWSEALEAHLRAMTSDERRAWILDAQTFMCLACGEIYEPGDLERYGPCQCENDE